MIAPEPEGPHRRFNPLTGEWVLVSAQRTERPWLGMTESSKAAGPAPSHDPDCYLCPGNSRVGGEINPDYSDTFIFTNDFPALLPGPAAPIIGPSPLFRTEAAAGTCRVLCFAPNHGLTLAEMDRDGIASVINVWADQTTELGATYRWVQVFENKGELMGASNPHPHGQIWASSSLPSHVATEDERQASYHQDHGTRLLEDYAQAEEQGSTRIVVANESWVAVIPYWATWPFESLLIPRRHVLRLPDLGTDEREALADVMKRLLVRYDNLFSAPFPYSMGWHGAPFQAGETDHWQLHAHIYPPLLRSASIRKFMVGYELLGEAQRDLTPEQAAKRLRAVAEVHYLADQPSNVT